MRSRGLFYLSFGLVRVRVVACVCEEMKSPMIFFLYLETRVSIKGFYLMLITNMRPFFYRFVGKLHANVHASIRTYTCMIPY